MRLLAPAFLALLLSASIASADVTLPAVLSDNMVLQANKPLRIWGSAAPQEKVTVKLAGQSQATTANAQGAWQVTFQPLKTGATLEMTVTGNNTLTVKNILVGSVWICSGQSNMEFGVKMAHNAATEIPRAKYPGLRLFMVANSTALAPQSDVTGKWVECSPETVVEGGWQGFSAVGYFFGRDIHVRTGLPVGLIESDWGGTPAQSWTSLGTLQKTPELQHYVDSPLFNDPAKAPEIIQADIAKAQKAYEAEQNKWQEEAAAAKAAGTKFTKAAPRKPVPDDKNPWTPTSLYNAMIAPLTPLTIEGVIWYQGESNAGAAVEYRTLFPAMITDWRQKWGQGDFPFYFVQLANFMPREEDPTDPNWAWLREAQTQALKLPNTAMAVIIDIGDGADIHPRDKMDVGDRLARQALKNIYGKDVVADGPMYDSMTIEGQRIQVKFRDTAGGLAIGVAPATQPGAELAKPAAELEGFAIAGADQKWVWAKARIDGNTVLVWSDRVPAPVAVRYAWANNPACNLYNKAGLPASPFRSDDFAKTAPAPRP